MEVTLEDEFEFLDDSGVDLEVAKVGLGVVEVDDEFCDLLLGDFEDLLPQLLLHLQHHLLRVLLHGVVVVEELHEHVQGVLREVAPQLVHEVQQPQLLLALVVDQALRAQDPLAVRARHRHADGAVALRGVVAAVVVRRLRSGALLLSGRLLVLLNSRLKGGRQLVQVLLPVLLLVLALLRRPRRVLLLALLLLLLHHLFLRFLRRTSGVSHYYIQL